MSDDLILILGDQLSPAISSLRGVDPARARVLMVEVAEETAYVPHHKKKIAFILSAMRHFAQDLRRAGWRVDYVTLDAPDNTGSFTSELERAVKADRPGRLIVTEPGEWRVMQAMRGWSDRLDLTVEIRPDTRFIASHDTFSRWAEGRKQWRMEYFYREMRRQTGLLMDGDAPEGGRWNFDAENRKPAQADLFLPPVLRFPPDEITRDVLALVQDRFAGNFGDLEPFWFATTAEQAEAALDHFIQHALPRFGETQDAMLSQSPFLHHSLLSFYINTGLLDPLAVCRRVEAAFYAGHAPLNSAEGFIRQIIGWREYVRGVYWHTMPGYLERNALDADRPLPAFYWTGDTDMACLRAVIGQTREHAYAHHIQRLMVTGNFAMLTGIDPKAVHEWYLSVYADAFEWVELPNTLGMSQFADGGLLGSKPYAASGAYIDKMSDYCAGCAYDVRDKTGPRACPFNPLYWDFLLRNERVLRGNPRLAPVYRTWDRMDPEKQASYRAAAAQVLARLDSVATNEGAA